MLQLLRSLTIPKESTKYLDEGREKEVEFKLLTLFDPVRSTIPTSSSSFVKYDRKALINEMFGSEFNPSKSSIR